MLFLLCPVDYSDRLQVMKKILKKITGFIPSHDMRHRMRCALDWPDGVAAHMRMARGLRRDDKRAGDEFRYNLALVAIIKNEGPYLREWLEYHKLVGVDKIYVYDNASDDDTAKILVPYIRSGFVDYTYFPGQKMQLPAYADAIAKHKYDTRWMAFIDLDEFLVTPNPDCGLVQYLGRHAHAAQICMKWIFFGANGHEERPSGLVIESYTRRATHAWQCKSIVNPRLLFGPFVHTGDVAGRTIYPKLDELRVNHYYCKSWAEYQRRKARGDALHGAKFATDTFHRADFEKHNYNDIYDDAILPLVDAVRRAIAQ